MRKTVNIDNANYERIRTLASKQKITITSVINMAVDRYITSYTLNETISDIMLKSLQEVAKSSKQNK